MELEVVADPQAVGGVFYKLLSGDFYNRCHLESLGSLAIIRGKLLLNHITTHKATIMSFECSLAHAGSVSVREVHDLTQRHISSQFSEMILPQKMFIIKGMQFAHNCPVEVITVEMILGSVRTDHDLPAPACDDQDLKQVCWCQTMVNFKSYDNIKLSDGYAGHRIEEILLDQLTLHCLAVTLPQNETLLADKNVALPQPHTILGRAAHLVRQMFYHPNHLLEVFLFFLGMLSWLLYLSYQPPAAQHSALSTVIVMAILIIAIVCLRGVVTALIRRAFPGLREFQSKSFFVNGWQARSFCGAILQGQSPPMYAMPDMFVENLHHGGQGAALPINQGHGKVPYHNQQPLPKKQTEADQQPVSPKRQALAVTIEQCDFLASDMFTVLADIHSKAAVVVGFLSQKQQFGCIATNRGYNQLSVHVSGDGVLIPSQGMVVSDPLVVYTMDGALEHSLDLYTTLSGQYNKVHERYRPERCLLDTAPSGWCSWYQYNDKISEDVLLANLTTMQGLREQSNAHDFKLFQIDDGYSTHWGDWLTCKPSFTSMRMLSEQIDSKGMIGGLWLAPFAADKDSALAKAHPDWLLAVNSANGGKFFHGLDVTNPSVQGHLRKVLRTMTQDWGFAYLKLDFLYAAALHGASHHDRTLTSAQVMSLGMGIIVDQLDACGKPYYLLGCGAPLGSVIGQVHANRISADAGLSWQPALPLPWWDRWNLPSARNMVRNTLNRLQMHNKWWINDPDCLILRDITAFTEHELIGIATAKALSGGSLIVSDDLDKVSPSRIKLLAKLLPPSNQAAIAIDLMEKEIPELFRMKMTKAQAKDDIKQQGKSVFDSNGSSPDRPPLMPDILLWKQFTRSGASTHSLGASTEEEDDGLPSILLPDNDVFVELPSERNILDLPPPPPPPPHPGMTSTPLRAPRLLNLALREPVAHLSEDDVMTNLFPSPTVYTRKMINSGMNMSKSFRRADSSRADSSMGIAFGSIHRTDSSGTSKSFRLSDDGRGCSLLDDLVPITISDDHDHDHDHDLHCASNVSNLTYSNASFGSLKKPYKSAEEAIRKYIYDPADLHKHWHIFAACNWSDNNASYRNPAVQSKAHFIHIQQIFSSQELAIMMDYMDILYHKEAFRAKYASSRNSSFHTRSGMGMTPGMRSDVSVSAVSVNWNAPSNPREPAKPDVDYKVILHLFNFWTESYHHKIITLDANEQEESGEVVLQGIPLHSAHWFHLSLSLHPMKPLYVGSNLHISCGTEVQKMFILPVVPVLHKRALVSYCNSALPRKRSKSNIFSSTISLSITPQICSVHLAFEPGALRNEAYDGCIYVFLPVSIRKARTYNHVLGRLDVSGPASSKQISPGGGGREASMVAYIEESSCFTAGYVYRIPVQRPAEGSSNDLHKASSPVDCEGSAGSSPASPKAVSHKMSEVGVTFKDSPIMIKESPMHAVRETSNPLPPLHPLRRPSDGHASCTSYGTGGGTFSEGDASPATGEKEADYIIISWIYDIIESSGTPIQPPSGPPSSNGSEA